MKDPYICSTTIVHEDAVKSAKDSLPESGEIERIAQFFKLFSDSTRMKILFALKQQELCVCDLSCVVEISQSAVSHQLKSLRQAYLVKTRKVGNVVYYSLDDDHVHTLLAEGFEHISHRDYL